MPVDSMTEEQELLETQKKAEALFSGTTFDGERNAAAEAIEAIRHDERYQGFDERPPCSVHYGLFQMRVTKAGCQPRSGDRA